MHAFLVFCVLAEAGFIGLLLSNARRQAIGADAFNERLDALIKERGVENIGDRLTEIERWAREISLLLPNIKAAHSDLVHQFGIGNDEKNVRLKALGDLTGIQAQLLDVFDAKLSDLIEGCAKLDADLTEASEDVRECVRLRQSDLAGLSERITEITDAQEKARRKSGSRTSPASYEGIRPAAEAGARKHPDPTHAELVALAQGPE